MPRTNAHIDLDPTTPGVAARVYSVEQETVDKLWLELYAEYGGQRFTVHGSRTQITNLVQDLARTLAALPAPALVEVA